MSRFFLLAALVARPWPDNNGVHINAHGGGFLYRQGVYWWFGEHMTEGREGWEGRGDRARAFAGPEKRNRRR